MYRDEMDPVSEFEGVEGFKREEHRFMHGDFADVVKY